MDLTKILQNFLDEKNRLTAYPSKKKMKMYALLFFAEKFESERRYTEKEVNELLNANSTFGDPATLRRELYNYRFIDRDSYGKEYWLEKVQPTLSDLGVE